MHVLLTRPLQDAEPLKTRLEELGCQVMLAPLMEIALLEIGAQALAGATGVIATSRNALAALAASPAMDTATHLTLFAVGPGTAAVARSMGFGKVIEGGGTGEDLVPILMSAGSTERSLVHLTGDLLAYDLEAALSGTGVNIVAVPAYRAIACQTLPAEVIKALQSRGIDIVTLMSPRTARIWARLVAGLSPTLQSTGLTYVCMSERVREALGEAAKDSKVLVPARPNIEEMLAVVKRLAGSPKAE
ncbi:uroporphyrinogen-III synthase [Hyphomicrobium sp.]|uniref:uroporphyrinogen-III synthase n=1 Tax=Hyphomicrobium sp. TaxID=82 RepID=UPI000FADD2AE|nr:uroporphyrinogen-III synthase [Hyphomicrobium sp.]RUP00047.1 MAG: uroporphyrinogen-III synthase [Hyphomicrobium sp.]